MRFPACGMAELTKNMETIDKHPPPPHIMRKKLRELKQKMFGAQEYENAEDIHGLDLCCNAGIQ